MIVKTVLIVCGALAREVLAIKEKYGWEADVWGVPALLHNRPDQIPPAVRLRIREARVMYDRVVVVYGDCGTGGMLDRLLANEGVERITGPHCFEMYANGVSGTFDKMMDDQIGTFFVTDYLVGSFEHLVIEELGLDRFPQLRDDYFAHYTRMVYLVQKDDPALQAKAQWAADFLKLPLELHRTGYGALESRLVERMKHGDVSDRVLA